VELAVVDERRHDVYPREGVQSRIAVGPAESRWTGWLRSREQQQLLIGHPAKILPPLKVKRIDGQRVLVTNTTSQPLPFAFLRDGDDGHFMAEGLLPGAAIECTRRTVDEIAGSVARYRAEYIATLPDGFNGAAGWYVGMQGLLNNDAANSVEMLDQVWNTYLSEGVPLPKHGFVTLLSDSSAVFVPLDSPVTDSRHLVVGRLAW
jgi:hypothetical protein